MCHSVQCTVHTSGLMSHVVLCVHAVVCGLGSIHRACYAKIYVSDQWSHTTMEGICSVLCMFV